MKHRISLIAGACLCATAIVGCVSVEQTRLQLQSKDSAEVKKAEENIIFYATQGQDQTGFIKFTPQQQIEYVSLLSNNETLFKIIDKACRKEVIQAAINKLDLSEKGACVEVCKCENIIRRIDEAELLSLANKMMTKLSEAELLEIMNELRANQIFKEVAGPRFVEIVTDQDVMLKILKDELYIPHKGGTSSFREDAAKIFAKRTSSITDERVVLELLKMKDRSRFAAVVKDRKIRDGLLMKLSETSMMGFVMVEMEDHSVREWNADDLTSFYDAITVASALKDPSKVVRLVSSVLSKLDQYKEECSSGMMSWAQSDKEKASKLKSQLPKLTDEMMVEMLCVDATSWKNYVGLVTPDVAYKVLVSKKAKTPALELELLKKVPSDKLDVSVYDSARADILKKAIYARLPQAQQKQVREANEKVFASVVEKAKGASKETFVLEGFYLGMSWEDMKIVLAHHFPELEATEKDDDGLELYVPNQKSAFCLANKEKKIYQFNFGKKMLKKWYKYDVQDYAQWARAYGREHKVDMQYKMVEKEATVYEPMDPSRSYKVWFCQHSYQYKHNAKEYRLTYFGDEKDFTVHGGIGGALIKQLAAKQFRYTRGDPGSLRVYIDKD